MGGLGAAAGVFQVRGLAGGGWRGEGRLGLRLNSPSWQSGDMRREGARDYDIDYGGTAVWGRAAASAGGRALQKQMVPSDPRLSLLPNLHARFELVTFGLPGALPRCSTPMGFAPLRPKLAGHLLVARMRNRVSKRPFTRPVHGHFRCRSMPWRQRPALLLRPMTPLPVRCFYLAHQSREHPGGRLPKPVTCDPCVTPAMLNSPVAPLRGFCPWDQCAQPSCRP